MTKSRFKLEEITRAWRFPAARRGSVTTVFYYMIINCVFSRTWTSRTTSACRPTTTPSPASPTATATSQRSTPRTPPSSMRWTRT